MGEDASGKTLQAAADQYGVVINHTGPADALVRLPEDYQIDQAATQAMRQA